MQTATTFKSFAAKGFAVGAARKLLGTQDVAEYVTCNADGKWGFSMADGLPVVPASAKAADATAAFVAAATTADAQVQGELHEVKSAPVVPVGAPSVLNPFQRVALAQAAKLVAEVQPEPEVPAAEVDVPAPVLGGVFGAMGATLGAVAQANAAKASAQTEGSTSVRTCKVEKDRPEQNGIKRPSSGGLCRAVWDFCDAHLEANGAPPAAAQVKAEAERVGWNMNNACIEFYQWRKYNGITGRAKAAPAAPKAE
jgi:hypothetical protein